jgi:glycosyltransferase involved in cell wall biosynthesis
MGGHDIDAQRPAAAPRTRDVIPPLPETILFTVCDSEFYGTQRNILSTAGRLDPARYIPIVAAPRGADFNSRLERAGIETIALPFKGLSDTATAAALRKLIRSRNVSLVHAHLGISTFLSLAAAAFTRTPVIATRHFIEDRYTTIESSLAYSAYRNVYRRINKRLRRVIFVSEAVRHAIESREGALGARGAVVPNGIDLYEDTLKEKLTPEELESLRARYGVPPDTFLTATLARLAPEKGLGTLLRAAALLKESKHRYLFIIAGEGPLMEQLERESEMLLVHDTVRFAGYINTPRELLAAAEAFVLPARAEPFGIAVLEAMATGVPVIVTKAGGPLEIIADGVSGLFFEPGDAHALAAHIERLASDADLRMRLVRGAHERVVAFDERSIALQIQNIYDEVISEARKRKN